MTITVVLVTALVVGRPLPLDDLVIRGNSINHTFGMVRNGGARAHQGWDFKAEVGQPIYAIAPYDEAWTGYSSSYGYWMQYKSLNSGYIYFHAHLLGLAKLKESGVVGDIVGYVGRSGNARYTDPHLHFEMRTSANPGLGLRNRVSPSNTFGSWENYLDD